MKDAASRGTNWGEHGGSMFPHAMESLRLNLCSFCSPGKLSAGAKAERAKIIKDPTLAADHTKCVELDKEKPKASLKGKGYGAVDALSVFKVGVSHDLYVRDQRSIGKAWPDKWDGMKLSDLGPLL